MSVIVNIFAAIGLIFLITYIVYYLYDYIKKMNEEQQISQIFPSPTYMQNVGINCPDYWVNMGIVDGNIKCKNSFNIPINGHEESKCTDEMYFIPVETGKTWEYGNPNNLKSLTDKEKFDFLNKKIDGNDDSMSRCEWVNKCSQSENTQGIWQGVNEICNSPDPSTKYIK